jgi:hypothetical protein
MVSNPLSQSLFPYGAKTIEAEGPFMIDPEVLAALGAVEGGRKGKQRRSLMERRWEIKTRKEFLQEAGHEITAEIDSQVQSAHAVPKNPRKSLYEKALEAREKAQSRLLAKAQAEKTTSKQLFRPALDRKSLRLQPRYEQHPIEDSLLQWGSQKDLHKKELQTSFSQVELVDCSFSPEIDPKSAHIAGHSVEPRYLALYQLSQTHHNEAESQPQFPFRPHIFASKSHPETHAEFISRLHGSKLRAGGTAASLKQADEPVVVPNGKHIKREGPPVYEHLYALAGRKEEQTHVEAQTREIVASPKSQQLFNKRLDERIKALFGAFDDDLDGLISGNVREMEGLGKEQKRLLDPILMEIKAAEEPWNLEQFSNRIKQLCSNLTIFERNSLLIPPKPPAMPSPKLLHKSNTVSFLRLQSGKCSEVSVT